MADSTGPAPALVPAGTAPDDATLTASGPRKNKGGRPRDEALYAQFHDVPSDGYHTHPQTACGHCGRQSIKLVDRMRAHLAKCGAYLAAAPELARTGARLPSLVPQRRRRNGEVAADKAAMREARAAAAADAVAGVRTLHQHVDPALVTPRTQRTALAAAAMAPSSAPPKARPSTNAGDAAGGLYTTFAADPRVAPRRRQTLPSLPASERERIDRQIVRTMAVNGWPLSIFDDEQGRMLLATLNSAYTPPDKATVERLTDELFEEMRVKVADVASLSSCQRMQGFERRAFIRAFTTSLDKFNTDTGIPLALAASRASTASRLTERLAPGGAAADAADDEMAEDEYEGANAEGPASS